MQFSFFTVDHFFVILITFDNDKFFEQSVNKVLAKKLIDEKTREYMNARRAAKVQTAALIHSMIHDFKERIFA